MSSPLPIDASLVPADVRAAGPKAQKLYETALGFEQVLLQQLTTELDQTTQSDGSDGTDATTTLYNGMLPDALAQGLTASGGIGLARELYRSLSAESK